MKKPKITAGEWMTPHLAQDDVECNCPYVLNEGYMGSVCDIRVGNGKRVTDGGNDAPPLEEAKANAVAISAVPEMIDELVKQNNLLYVQLESLEWLRNNKGNVEDIEGWVQNQIELLGWRIKANEEVLKKSGCLI